MELPVQKSEERLDKFLASQIAKLSRAQLQEIIRTGGVTVNGVVIIKPSFTLKENDRVHIGDDKLVPPAITMVVEPEPDIPLEVVYEDRDMVAVNKPAGLLVHPTFSQPLHTLVNALIARYPEMKTVGENPLRPGIIHRLDKDTSGIIVAAKNQNAFMFLKDQFLNRRVSKTYLALVEGVPKEKDGVINYDIRPSTYNRLKKVAVKTQTNADGTRINAEDSARSASNQRESAPRKKSQRLAKTLYKVKESFGDKFSLLEVMPQTGRTHQIRVHLTAIGHPIVGDMLYGANRVQAHELGVKRQFLHAERLEIISPDGTPLKLEAALPEELRAVLKNLAG